MQPPRDLTQLSIRRRDSIKLCKNRMDFKVLKSHQCSLERSHAVLIEINSEF